MKNKNSEQYKESLITCKGIIKSAGEAGVKRETIKMAHTLISIYPNMPADRAYELSFKICRPDD